VKVYLRTFGCRANHYDSEAVREMVLAAGGEIVERAEDADAAVFNSCAVTAEAEADLRQAVRRAARTRPSLRSVVMGCAAALPRGDDDERAPRALPTVQHVVPGADIDAVASALGLPPVVTSGSRAQSGARALLRVQDGCDEHCTFCATTIARGANRSRPMSDVVEEARRLAEWHPEIVLTGVHVGAYGRDCGTSLGTLVERLVRDVPAVRFRLASVEATEIDARLADLLRGAEGHVCPYVHAPLQSGSDRVLRRMGRSWYVAGAYADAVLRLVDGRPAFGIGADVIAGFPGESEADHEATIALVERLPVTHLHVFPYSLRPGTPAERLGQRVDPATVARRARELRALGARKTEEYARRRAGSVADVVVVGDGARREGLTEDYLTVALQAPAPPRRSRIAARLVRDDAGRLVAQRIAPTEGVAPSSSSV
jgi:threonylcarbamoyladenosine tRNA methylthiotransferase MtaB